MEDSNIRPMVVEENQKSKCKEQKLKGKNEGRVRLRRINPPTAVKIRFRLR